MPRPSLAVFASIPLVGFALVSEALAGDPPARSDEAPLAVAASEGEALVPARDDDANATPIVEAFVAPSLGFRWLDYSDGLTDNLRDYAVGGVPGIGGAVAVHPFARVDAPVIPWLGLVFDGNVALGLSSAIDGGDEYPTQWSRIAGGLRLRVPMDWLVLGGSLSLAYDRFTIEGSGPIADELPSTTALSLRGRVEARVSLGPVAPFVTAAYLGPLSKSGIYDRVREPTLGGIELGGGLAVPIAHGFEVRAGAQYTRWYSSFEPVPGDPFVAGGALEQQLRIEVGPAYAY
jgi:hypothetical protein